MNSQITEVKQPRPYITLRRMTICYQQVFFSMTEIFEKLGKVQKPSNGTEKWNHYDDTQCLLMINYSQMGYKIKAPPSF